jgi:hypothetical protein
LSIGIAAGLRFNDAVPWRGLSAGNIGNEKGRIFQIAHAEVGGLFLIPDADEEISGPGALKGGGIDEDEAIVFINHLDDADEAGHLSLGSLRPPEGKVRKPGKGCDQERAFGLRLRRRGGAGGGSFFACWRWSRLGRAADARQSKKKRSQSQAFQLPKRSRPNRSKPGRVAFFSHSPERLANDALQVLSLLAWPPGKRNEEGSRALSRGSLRLRIRRRVGEHEHERDPRKKKSAHRCRQ